MKFILADQWPKNVIFFYIFFSRIIYLTLLLIYRLASYGVRSKFTFFGFEEKQAFKDMALKDVVESKYIIISSF